MSKRPDVLFPVMPYFNLSAPAAGVSLLKAEIARHGFGSAVWYLNFAFAERVGLDAYDLLDGYLAGEWVFARAAYGDLVPGEEQAKDWILHRMEGDYGRMPERWKKDAPRRRRHLRERVLPCALQAVATCRGLMDEWVRDILDARPRLVGFSTMFGQSGPGVALAYRLKREPDAPLVMFGGAGCQDEMGLEMLRRFPWIDYVCVGEGDASFPAFLEGLLRGRDTGPLPGILVQGKTTALTVAPPTRALDDLPIPDYDEFYERRRRSPLDAVLDPAMVLMEASRGCWWGAKHQCRFCGLGGVELQFRSKSPERALDEAAALVRRSGSSVLQFTDNVIDIHHIEPFFHKLSERLPGIAVKCEIKSNFSRNQLAALRAGGVTVAQPGIESFSNRLLRHMSKGCTAPQNICVLRWCRELGIEASWLVLYGFPGEPAEEYARMAERLPLLFHLQPPAACNRISLQRFSPYWRERASCGVSSAWPRFDYRFVFPLEGADPSGLCAHFDFDYEDGRRLDYVRSTVDRVEAWRRLWQVPPERVPRLDFYRTRDGATILDTRHGAKKAAHRLSGTVAELYLLCDKPTTIPALGTHFAGRLDEAEIRDILDELLASGLVWEEEAHVVALALLHNRPPS